RGDRARAVVEVSRRARAGAAPLAAGAIRGLALGRRWARGQRPVDHGLGRAKVVDGVGELGQAVGVEVIGDLGAPLQLVEQGGALVEGGAAGAVDQVVGG